MSASAAGSPGQTPNGAPPPILRRRPNPNADPLVRKKKPRRPPPHATAATNVNGIAGAGGTCRPHTYLSQHVAPGAAHTGNKSVPAVRTGDPKDMRGLDWPYEDVPLVTVRKSVMEGLRHHVIRFLAHNQDGSPKLVDLFDESQFTRPIRLYRRDPRAPPPGALKEEDEEESKDGDDKERERQRILREQRQQEREEAQKQIAPTVQKGRDQKYIGYKKKTEQVYRPNDTEEAKKASQLRYEEALPWHLEDFDTKNLWTGHYEAALSGCHVMFMIDENGAYRIMPLDKWYKLTAKSHFKKLTIDEAEQKMGKKMKDPRWFMDALKVTDEKRREQALRRGTNKLLTRKGGRGEGASSGGEDGERPEVAPDADDIDYNYDEAFADDEEPPIFDDPDGDAKEAEERMKREQREANIFDIKEQKDFDQEEADAEEEARLHKKLAKSVRKALMKQEKNYVYEETDGSGTSDETSTEGSESEAAPKDENVKKEDDSKVSADKPDSKPGGKSPSESPTKGTNTPSGRNKPTDPAKKTNLKRPGSPYLSDAGGQDPTRKKQKKDHLSSQPDKPGTAPSTSTAGAAAPGAPQKSSIVKVPVDPSKFTDVSNRRPAAGAGAGSGSEGEMSDGTKRKRLKLRMGSPTNGTPSTSRAGSPGAAAVNGADASTANPASVAPPPTAAKPPPVTEELIAAAIPPGGIRITDLTKAINLKGLESKALIAMIKKVAKFDAAAKIIYPKEDVG